MQRNKIRVNKICYYNVKAVKVQPLTNSPPKENPLSLKKPREIHGAFFIDLYCGHYGQVGLIGHNG